MVRTLLLTFGLLVAVTAGHAASVASAIPGATSPARPAREPISLRYQWNEDQPLVYRISQQTEAEVSGVPGQEQSRLSQSQTMRVRMDVTEVADDGTATITATLEAVQFQMTPPDGEPISYDSEADSTNNGAAATPQDEPEHPAARAMAAFVGESFTFKITPEGDVQNVQGMSEILQKIGEQSGDPAMQETFRGKFGNDAMEALLEQAFKMLPAEKVEAGATWQTTVEQAVPTLGTLQMQSTMTLDSVQPDNGGLLARVPITMSTTLDRAQDGGLPPGATLTLEDATGKGVMFFDVDRGQIHHLEMVSQLPIRMSMQAGAETVTISQDITSTMKMERVNGETPDAASPDKDADAEDE